MYRVVLSVLIVLSFNVQTTFAQFQEESTVRGVAIVLLQEAHEKGIASQVKRHIQKVLAPYTDNVVVQDLGLQIDTVARTVPRDLQVKIAASLKEDRILRAMMTSEQTPKDQAVETSNVRLDYKKDIMYLNRIPSRKGWAVTVEFDGRLTNPMHLVEMKTKLDGVGPVIALESGSMLVLQILNGEDETLNAKFLEVEVGGFGEPDIAREFSPLVFPAADAMSIYDGIKERLAKKIAIRKTGINFLGFTQFAKETLTTFDRPLMSICTTIACSVADVVVSPLRAMRWAWRRTSGSQRTDKELQKLERLSTNTNLIVFPLPEYLATKAALLEELKERYETKNASEVCRKALGA